MTTKRKIYVSITWISVAVCMTVIFWLSSQNGEESSELSSSFVDIILEQLRLYFDEGILRTCAHGLEFMGLSLLTFNAVYSTWEHRFTFLITWLSSVLYAVTDEIHQIFVPERAFQITDILVDGAGAFLGALAAFIILKIILSIKKRGNKDGSIKTV